MPEPEEGVGADMHNGTIITSPMGVDPGKKSILFTSKLLLKLILKLEYAQKYCIAFLTFV